MIFWRIQGLSYFARQSRTKVSLSSPHIYRRWLQGYPFIRPFGILLRTVTAALFVSALYTRVCTAQQKRHEQTLTQSEKKTTTICRLTEIKSYAIFSQVIKSVLTQDTWCNQFYIYKRKFRHCTKSIQHRSVPSVSLCSSTLSRYCTLTFSLCLLLL